jgi:hypothetical protein
MHPLHQQIHQAIAHATSGMTEEQLLFRPEGKWSSAHILEHLSLTYSLTARALERCLREGKPSGGAPSVKQRLMAFTVTSAGLFPPGRKSPPMVEPKGSLGGLESVQKIQEALIAMDRAYVQCLERFGPRVCLADHPVLGPLTARQWPRFHLVHTRHHMRQIAQLRDRVAVR